MDKENLRIQDCDDIEGCLVAKALSEAVGWYQRKRSEQYKFEHCSRLADSHLNLLKCR
jgi:hypothetical protein